MLRCLTLVALVAASRAHAADAAAAACCSCQIQSTESFSDDRLPCDFDVPSGWKVMTGDDGAMVSAVAGGDCSAACPVSSGVAFSVAKKPNSNAETMEQIWLQALQVAGKANCGDAVVTFFNPPGADPTGLIGGVQFHVGHGGRKYGGHATFTCPAPGEWMRLQQLFIDSFRTNPSATFPGD